MLTGSLQILLGLVVVLVSELLNREKPRGQRVFFAITGVAIAGVGVWQLIDAQHEKAAAALSGSLDLSVANPIKCFKAGPTGAVMNLDPTGATKPMFLFAAGLTANDLRVGVEEGQLVVYGDIRDERGEVVARLARNEWLVAKPAALDRNYDDHALEVVDRTGDVVLQLRLKQDCLEYQFKLFQPDGSQFAVLDAPGDLSSQMIIARPPRRIAQRIVPLFKYPSELHLGELAAGVPD